MFLEPERSVLTPQGAAAAIVFGTIPSIGPVTARSLALAGCQSLTDLQLARYSKLLTPSQRLNVKYFYALREPITKSDVETVTNLVRDRVPYQVQLYPTGEYRLGASKIKTIHLLATHPNVTKIPPPEPLLSDDDGQKIKRGPESHFFQQPDYLKSKKEGPPILQYLVKYLQGDQHLLAEPFK